MMARSTQHFVVANFYTCLLTVNLGYLSASSVELRVWMVC
jgi:hypothetical protein